MRTQHFSSALRSALESREVEVTVVIPEAADAVASAVEVPVVVEEVPELPGESAEDSVIAADEAAAEVAEGIAESNELEEVTQGLESILANVEAETAGLDPVSAKFVNLAVESYVGKWNLGVSLVPSAESFGGTLSRRQATASLEANIGEVLKKAWDYIKQLYHKVVEAVKAFFGRIFIAAQRLLQRAKALKARSAGLAATPREDHIDVGALVTRYSVGKDIGTSLTDAFKKISALVDLSTQVDFAAAAIETEAAKVINTLLTAKDEGFDAVYDTAIKGYSVTPPAFFKAATGSTTEFATAVFPGEKVYTAVRGGDGSLRFDSTTNDVTVEGSKIPTPRREDIASMADVAAAFAEKAIATKASFKSLQDESSSAFLKALKENTDITGVNERKVKAFVQRAAGDALAARQCTMRILADGVKAGLAVVAVGEKAAKQYETLSTKPVDVNKQIEAEA